MRPRASEGDEERAPRARHVVPVCRPSNAAARRGGRARKNSLTPPPHPPVLPLVFSYASLAPPLPDPLVAALFDAVLAAGRLHPTNLRLFLEAGCADVDARVATLRVRLPPPVVPDSHRPWLGDKAGWQ